MKKLYGLLLIIIITLTACNQAPTESNSNAEGKTVIQYNDEAKLLMELPISKSPIKGITNDSTISIDYNNMEKDLTEIARQYVNTKKIIFSPGTTLTADDATTLLGRESENAPLALNPAAASDLKDSPIYANTIIEQDFFTKDKNDKVYDTVAIGVGINPIYTYTDAKGKEQKRNITDEEIKDYVTSELSTKVISYLRQEKKIKSKIIVAFYKENTDPTLPGSYLTYGVAQADENKLADIKTNQIEYKIFPDAANEKESDVNGAINNFQKEISSYFKDYSSATAIGKYENGKLVNMSINVNINNYSSSEVDAFVSFIETNSKELLSFTGNVDYQIITSGGNNVGLLTFKDGTRRNRYIYNVN